MIPIRNIFHMLSYAFKELRKQGYRKMETEDFENIYDLMAAILDKGIGILIKQGLRKEYRTRTEELSTLRGKIDIAASIKGQSMIKNKLFCTYDEFSVDNKMNQILKSTVYLLIASKKIRNKSRIKELKKLMVYFSDVSLIDLKSVNWNLQYNRNQKSYELLIAICHLVVNGLLQTKKDGENKEMDFDEEYMPGLYERFIREYYAKHYPELNPSARHIEWCIDKNEDEKDKKDENYNMLPIMKTDIHLQKGNTVLIIDAKYYSSSTQKNFNKETIHSSNLYQIFTYVKNRQYELGKDNSVSGMLLYAQTDADIHPNNTYMMSGNKISCKTLDLNVEFSEIEAQLKKIVEDHFPS